MAVSSLASRWMSAAGTASGTKRSRPKQVKKRRMTARWRRLCAQQASARPQADAGHESGTKAGRGPEGARACLEGEPQETVSCP